MRKCSSRKSRIDKLKKKKNIVHYQTPKIRNSVDPLEHVQQGDYVSAPHRGIQRMFPDRLQCSASHCLVSYLSSQSYEYCGLRLLFFQDPISEQHFDRSRPGT